MFVSADIFKNENNIGKESGDEASKLHLRKEEFNISKNKMQNSVVGLDKQVVQSKKIL